MTELSEADLIRLENSANAAERELESQVVELEADLKACAADLREVSLRLEEEQNRGAYGLDGVLSRLHSVEPPKIQLNGHAQRLAEVRADHARARLWLAKSLREDLERLTFELGHAVGIADEGRAALQKLVEQPRVNARARDKSLQRAKSITEELAGAGQRGPVDTSKRRQLPRLRFEVAIDLHSRSNFYTGVTENISEGGIFVATTDRPPIGSPVEVAFTLPSGHEIRGRGELRWTREPASGLSGGIGIGFEGLPDLAKAHIDDFLQSRAPIVREP